MWDPPHLYTENQDELIVVEAEFSEESNALSWTHR